MTWTFNEQELDQDLNRVRMEIGDTDTNRQLLTNEEIEEIISEHSVFFVRVAKCCRLICMKFANLSGKYRLEGFQEDRTAIYGRYKELAAMYEAKAGGPWIGSIDADTKTDNEENTDLVTPRFKIGMHDNS